MKLKKRTPAVILDMDHRAEFSELREALEIDRDSLDEACLRQPVIFNEVSELHAMACSERDAAKESLATTDAKVAHVIRTSWNVAGEKYSEARVGDAVQMKTEHQEAYNHWSNLARRALYLGALKDSFDQRARMLSVLANLFVSGYFDRVVGKASQRDVARGEAGAAREAMRKARQSS